MPSAEAISELLLRWDELREQGREVSAEELCRDCPELTDEARRRINVLKAMYRVPNAPPTGDVLPRWATPPLPVTTPAGPSASAGLSAQIEVPGYEILQPLGSGGMGRVFKARHARLKRLVALKMIIAGAHANAEQLARFRTEAQAAARLHHPNIVQIYEVGEQGGIPYLALEYVDGGSLLHQLKGRPVPPRQAAELLKTLALAIQHAHERGIIHRDLKPANILVRGTIVSPGIVTRDGSSTMQHSPLTPYELKITDFGLAKQLDQESGQTRTGAVMGTPSYMAPEQAMGRGHEVGPATDVYALGAVLYELLTGRPPFEAATLLETLEQVQGHDPAPPRSLQPQVPLDLETICLKCLQKDPGQRYASALALADDLGRFLEGEPIAARRPSWGTHLTRLLNRRQRLVLLRTLLPTIIAALSPLAVLGQSLLYLLAAHEPFYAGASVALTLGLLVLLIGFVAVLYGTRPIIQPLATDRQLRAIRFSLILGFGLLLMVCYLTAPTDRPWNALTVYPLWSVLAGVIFFIVGGTVWGRFYLLSLSFFAGAVVMALYLDWSGLIFGLIMSVGVFILSLHLIRMCYEGLPAANLEGRSRNDA